MAYMHHHITIIYGYRDVEMPTFNLISDNRFVEEP